LSIDSTMKLCRGSLLFLDFTSTEMLQITFSGYSDIELIRKEGVIHKERLTTACKWLRVRCVWYGGGFVGNVAAAALRGVHGSVQLQAHTAAGL